MTASILKQTAPEWCFFGMTKLPVDEYYRRVKAMGYQGVEMADPKHWPAARAAGLEIVDLCAPGMRKGLNDRRLHGEIVPQILAAIEQAAANGIANVVIFSGNREGRDDDDGARSCIAGIKQLAGDAEKRDVTLLFETLCTQDHADYQADSFRFAAEVVRGVASPRVKVLYDIYHMFKMGEDVKKTVISNLSLIGHLHIAGAPKRDFPGPGPEQLIDYAPIVRAIHSAGYRGWWGQEFCPTGDALDEMKRARELFDSFVVHDGVAHFSGISTISSMRVD